MDLKRFFVEEKIKGKEVALTGDEFHHAVKVCRLKAGFKFIVCDNSGYDYYCTVTSVLKDKLTGKVDKTVLNETNSGLDITLYIGANKELDKVVQKAVEMGVKTLIPFISKHTNIASINMERLQKIVLESSKQCGRAILMQIKPLTNFSEAVKKSKSVRKLFFYEHERKKKVSSVLKEDVFEVALFIGGEGGFSAEEFLLAQENNCVPVTLGTRILRVETAVVSALTLILQGTNRI